MAGSAPQAGFYYQNNIAALKIIDCLFFKTDIIQIRLENYDKGHHIDDVIIYKKDSTEYYQIKWSDDSDNSFSLYSLLNHPPLKKSIFKQLAEGYLSVKPNNVSFSIILFTTKRESAQKRPSENIFYGLPEIRSNVLDVIKQKGIRYDTSPIFDNYQATLETIRTECGLDKATFDDFLKKLEFQFSQEPTEQIQNALKFKFNRLGIDENLLETLLDGVVKWSITGEPVTKEKVLRQLDITNRFEDKLSQYFRTVDEKFYVPNVDLLDKIESALKTLAGGYIFIEGSPGIGKSTALIKFKEQYPNLSIAYYCFIPDAKNDFGELRHKAFYFLKSLCIAIESSFPDVDLPLRYSDKFEEKLRSYIEKLGSLKKKIVFIIDGLDHVHRDIEFQQDSLLNQIKGKLPDGVFFILTSQYKSVLTQSVLTEITSEPKRHIVVSKFSQGEIAQYLSNKGINANDIIDKVERVSWGIPLYLHYITELLITVERKDYDKVLKELPVLADGKINAYHDYLFQKIENDIFAKWVMAVLAYRKENTSPETIEKLLRLTGLERDIVEVIKVITAFSHLLKQKDGRSFTIFHNSFREYIIAKSLDLKDKFNSALALYYEQEPYSDEAYRNYFRHLFEIEEYKKVINATTLEWIKNAWANYRTVAEIRDNIEIALNASIEILSLSEYIRIGFLKAQVAILDWNIQNSEIDFPILYLNANLLQNSLRSIWDGDFVLTSKEYFAYYIGKYYTKTGNLLPQNIIQQGFSKSSMNNDASTVANIECANSLISDHPDQIFRNIDTIIWIKDKRSPMHLNEEPVSEAEKEKINLGIKLKVIKYLESHNKYEHLLALSNAFKTNSELYPRILISIVKLLIGSEKSTAIKILHAVDFTDIPDNEYFEIVTTCCSYLTNDEIKAAFKEREVIKPVIHDNVIDEIGGRYGIHDDIIKLFDSLKPVWIFHPEMIKELLIRVSILKNPAKDIYNSIFLLSELWNNIRLGIVTESDKTRTIERTLKALYVQRPKELRKTHQGLFDFSGDDTFISTSIDSLFISIFNFGIITLSEQSIKKIIDYWLSLEGSDDGYRHYKIPLGIAKVINGNHYTSLSTCIFKVIQHAESIARNEMDTVTLTMSLGEVAGVYGLCGFKEDFVRVYNQLIETSFGVGYRKDYQASYIVSALRAINKIDSGHALNRLYEVFKIQKQLGEAGNGRMLHICLSDLIAYTVENYPELAFTLLQKEEYNLDRSEAIKIITEPLIKTSDKTSLHLLYSIIKTLPKWEKGGSRENHFLKLSYLILERAIKVQDEQFISTIIEDIKLNIIVELEDETELSNFSTFLLRSGIDTERYNLAVEVKNDVPTMETKKRQEGKFLLHGEKPSIEGLIQLFDHDYSIFEATIKNEYSNYVRNKRNRTLRNEYYRLKPTFEKFYSKLPADQTASLKISRIIRYYIEFKNSVVLYDPLKKCNGDELKAIFTVLISNIDNLLSNNVLKSFVESEFELDKWIGEIEQFLNERNNSIDTTILTEEEIYLLVLQVSIIHSDSIVAFIDKWTTGKTNAFALLKFANRIVSLNTDRAKDLLYRFVRTDDKIFLFPSDDISKELGFDLLETFIKADNIYGKKFLLRSYNLIKGEYGYDLIANIDKLVKYQKYFDDANVAECYYQSNLQYNKELAKGLPEKDNTYAFILTYVEQLQFSEIVIRYLVDLLNYPVIKVRELVLKSLFDLIIDNSDYFEVFLKYIIKIGNENVVEFGLILMQAVALKQPSILFQFKSELFSFTKRNHFFILELVKGLLFRIHAYNHDFLTEEEILALNSLNTKSQILLSSPIRIPIKRKPFIYSSYQASLIDELSQNAINESNIIESVYSDLVKKGFGNYSAEEDMEVHKHYNINTNFDTIEISTPYCEDVKSAINSAFYEEVKRGNYRIGFIDKMKLAFRLYDPSKLLINPIRRPEYINWISNGISVNDFEKYNDFEDLIKKFQNREQDYVTLYEFGSQRPKYESSENSFSCYFEVFSYLKKKGVDDSTLFHRGKQLSPCLRLENSYAFEMPSMIDTRSDFPIPEIKPILMISNSNYRGERDLSTACLLPNIFNDFEIETISLADLLIERTPHPLMAFIWQSEYTSSTGRRRYKPISNGFVLKIKKEVILNYLSKTDYILCFDIMLRRSATAFYPESHKNWYSLNKIFDFEHNG